MFSPAVYASRYLPVSLRSGSSELLVRVDRYHLGTPTAVQQTFWSALGEHFVKEKRRNRAYQLPLVVNGVPHPVADREAIRQAAVRPFWGKGSPEDCQVVLQLALLLGLTTVPRLQAWADANLGLDCNGFVGNYLLRMTAAGIAWWSYDGKEGPGPSKTIDVLFEHVAGKDGSGAVFDLDALDPSRIHLVVRTDASGRVIPGPSPVGHVALTEPGQFTASYSSMDLTRAGDGMIGKPALRTVESTGPVRGLMQNWMVFLKPHGPKGVFEVTRDGIRKLDLVRLAPLPARAS